MTRHAKATIETDTIGECWLQSVRQVLQHGAEHRDEDVTLREILGLTIHIRHPQEQDEFIATHADMEVLQRTLDKFEPGADMPDRPFTYGQRIHDAGGINQYRWLVQRIQGKPETKSATINLLVPGDASPNLPCLVVLDAKVRDDRLHLQFFFRSQNIFGRQYANLAALARLQGRLAADCGMLVGSLSGMVASAHIYAYDYPQAEQLLTKQLGRVVDMFYSAGPRSLRKDGSAMQQPS